MGIDFEKMKAKRDAVENRDNRKSVFWRPEDGEQTIRILPTSDGDPFKQYWFHYNFSYLLSYINWLRCMHQSSNQLPIQIKHSTFRSGTSCPKFN